MNTGTIKEPSAKFKEDMNWGSRTSFLMIICMIETGMNRLSLLITFAILFNILICFLITTGGTAWGYLLKSDLS